jgi:hypothetical protein
VSECDSESSIMKRPWPTRGCCVMEKKSFGEMKEFIFLLQIQVLPVGSMDF